MLHLKPTFYNFNIPAYAFDSKCTLVHDDPLQKQGDLKPKSVKPFYKLAKTPTNHSYNLN